MVAASKTRPLAVGSTSVGLTSGQGPTRKVEYLLRVRDQSADAFASVSETAADLLPHAQHCGATGSIALEDAVTIVPWMAQSSNDADGDVLYGGMTVSVIW